MKKVFLFFAVCASLACGSVLSSCAKKAAATDSDSIKKAQDSIAAAAAQDSANAAAAATPVDSAATDSAAKADTTAK